MKCYRMSLCGVFFSSFFRIATAASFIVCRWFTVCATAETIYQMERETLQNLIRLFYNRFCVNWFTWFLSVLMKMSDICSVSHFATRMNNSTNSAKNGIKTAITRWLREETSVLFTFDKIFRNVLKSFDSRAKGRDPKEYGCQTIWMGLIDAF